MSLRLCFAIVGATLVAGALTVNAQNPPPPRPSAPAPQAPAPNADPYANNPNAGATRFPLAAAAGTDSGKATAPAGAINQGASTRNLEMGPLRAACRVPGVNPAKLKLMQGAGDGMLFAATDPSTCAMLMPVTIIWTEMQHGQTDWQAVARMWRTCPNAKAVPGARVAYTDEREIQHALDAGALVVVVPTVDTVAEAIQARDWTYFPPLGRRSNGGGQAFDAAMWGGVPGGYRGTANDNIVLILMIETLEGVKNADEIAKVAGVSASSRQRNSQLLHTGRHARYERAINIVHDAAVKAGVKLRAVRVARSP
jgi:hypothetical protein